MAGTDPIAVTDVEIESRDGGGSLRVQVTVTRLNGAWARLGAEPRADDVPADVRAALVRWASGGPR